jgi:signal transduction histidine kinase/CheY-like chemotaxis protein
MHESRNKAIDLDALEPVETLEQTLGNLRFHVQARMLWLMISLGGLVLGIALFQDIRAGYYGNSVFYVVVYALIVSSLMVTSAPYLLRAGVSLLGIYALGSFELWNSGTDSVGSMWLLAFCIFCCVFLGARAAWVATALSITSMIALSVVREHSNNPDLMLVDIWSLSQRHWLPDIMSLGLLSLLSVTFIAFLLENLEASIKRSRRYLSVLREERNQLTEEVAERRSTEHQLRHAQRMETVGHLAGGVAHDFNNLLQVISGYTELALGGLSNDDSHYNDLRHVHKAAEQAKTLTRQLLAFSRQEVSLPRHVDLTKLVAGQIKMLGRLISADIEIVFVPSEQPSTVYADSGQIEQVLVNFCVNARDAMPQGGSLTIEVSNVVLDERSRARNPEARPGNYVVLSVTDTGYGMDWETQQKIFDPFFTTKEVGKGTGLGLATAFGTVRQHNGFLDVSSTVNAGTSMRVYLPAAKNVAEDTADAFGGAVLPSGSETLLLAEDEEVVKQLATKMLKKAGYAVLTAGNGEEALALFDNDAPAFDLVILDVIMPKLGGRDTLEKIRLSHPALKCLFISGYPADTILGDVQDKSNIFFLQKPFRAESLLNKVREVLDA